MTEATRTVATPNKAQAEIAALAALPRTLMGGTEAMRLAGEKYLPKEEAESKGAYACRLNRSFLFNAFAKTVADMTGKVFAKPIVLKDDVPEQIKEYAENIDLTGRHINVFARDVFLDALQPGVGYILVEMPIRPETLPENAPIAKEKAAGIRPYLVYIPAERLIGWKSTTINGAETLTQVRIREWVTEPDGEFHEKEVEQVRVLTPGAWQTYRRSPDRPEEWVPHLDGTTSLAKITLVPVYTNRKSFMTGTPPFANLAELSVAHWQSQSDQKNILHIARSPILFWAGKTDDDDLIVGANSMTYSSSPDAKLVFVEHSGKAIDSGDKDIQNLEFQMQAMGLQLLVNDPGQSATGEIRDDSKENSPLAMMARSLGDAVEEALGLMAEYMRLGEDAGGEVEINTDFGIAAAAAVDVPNILAAYSAGLLDRETTVNELKRRAVLADSVDVETVISRAKDEEAAILDAGAGKGMNLGAGAAA